MSVNTILMQIQWKKFFFSSGGCPRFLFVNIIHTSANFVLKPHFFFRHAEWMFSNVGQHWFGRLWIFNTTPEFHFNIRVFICKRFLFYSVDFIKTLFVQFPCNSRESPTNWKSKCPNSHHFLRTLSLRWIVYPCVQQTLFICVECVIEWRWKMCFDSDKKSIWWNCVVKHRSRWTLSARFNARDYFIIPIQWFVVHTIHLWNKDFLRRKLNSMHLWHIHTSHIHGQAVLMLYAYRSLCGLNLNYRWLFENKRKRPSMSVDSTDTKHNRIYHNNRATPTAVISFVSFQWI